MVKKVLLALGMAAVCHSSFATMQLGIASGNQNLIINDNAAGDLNSGAGNILYFNSDFNGWQISVVAGLSNAPNLSPVALDLAILATCRAGSACATGGVNDLFAAVGDNGFTQQAVTFNTFFSSTHTSGTAQQWAYETNIGFGTNIPAGFFATVGAINAPGGSGSATGGGPKGPGAYTLVLLQRYSGTGTFSADGNITVPEPGTLALMGLALGVAGLGARRKKVQA